MSLRILMVTRETGPDRRFGLGKSLQPIVEALRASGVETRYFCQDDLTTAQLQRREGWWRRMDAMSWLRNRPPLALLARAWGERLQVGWEAAQVARAHGYTHVHAHDPWIAAGVALALLRHHRSGLRWGFTQHGFGSYSRATHEDGLVQSPRVQRLMRRIEAIVSRRAHWVMAPTRSALEAAAADLREPALPAHWHAVPHARPPVPPGGPAARAATRAALGWAEDSFVVLAVGRLTPLKHFERIVEACAAQSPRPRLVILGEGEAEPLRAAAEALGYGGQLHIEAVQEVTHHLHAADLYVSASATESFGLANLEALCAGLPCVCSAVGGVPEVAGGGAWLVPNDTGSLGGCIAALMADAALRRDWSARALAHTAAWPDAMEIARRYVEIYQSAE